MLVDVQAALIAKRLFFCFTNKMVRNDSSILVGVAAKKISIIENIFNQNANLYIV